MVIVQRHDLKKRAQLIGNYGAGIGKVYGMGKRRLRKRNNLFENLGNKLLDMGMNLYDQNKDKINQVIKEKGADLANKLIDKAKTSDILPDFAKKKLVDNSELISNMSKMYIDQMVNKGSQFADVGVNMANAGIRNKIADMAGPITQTPYIKREAPITTFTQSSNIYQKAEPQPKPPQVAPPLIAETKPMFGYGQKRYRHGRGLNIL
jgi:hypothetical protein